MNRLELVQRLSREAGVNSAGPTSTLSQTGEYARLVNWIDGAWNEIQQKYRWDFLWEQTTVTIATGTNLTAGSIPAHRYDKDGTYNDTTQLSYMPWKEFRSTYPGAIISDGTPSNWSIRPDKAFVVDAKPTADLALTVERWANPIAMAADTDEPAMPSEHHMAIVWKALLMYANFEEAGVTRETARVEFNRHIDALGVVEAPSFDFGGPLC